MLDVNSSASHSPDQVWILMREFVERYSPKEQLLVQLGPKVGSGRGKVYTLMRLAEGPLGQGELADVIGVDRPYATVIVNQLESEGLAERPRIRMTGGARSSRSPRPDARPCAPLTASWRPRRPSSPGWTPRRCASSQRCSVACASARRRS